MSYNSKKKELIEAVAVVADNANLKTTVKKSCKGGLICGGISILGGLLMGPLGLAIGGTVGGIAAAVMSDSFQPIGKVIKNDLTNSQKEELIKRIKAVITDMDVTDVQFILKLMNNSSIQMIIVNVVKAYFENVLKMKIID